MMIECPYLSSLDVWHGPLDRSNMLDHLFITSDCHALKNFFRRSEYAVPDAISNHGDRIITLKSWKMFGFAKTLGAYKPKDIRDIIFEFQDVIRDKNRGPSHFMDKVKWSETFLRFSKTDYMKQGIWTVSGTTPDLHSDGNCNIILHLHNRLVDGEVLHADSPLLGIRIDGVTVPLDYKFLVHYDKTLSHALGLEKHFNIKGQSRRKGAASSMGGANIDLAEVRTAGRWSNGVMDRYVKKAPARLAELDVLSSANALRNRQLGMLPQPVNF